MFTQPKILKIGRVLFLLSVDPHFRIAFNVCGKLFAQTTGDGYHLLHNPERKKLVKKMDKYIQDNR